MNFGVHCGRAETLAGAIALGEANETERKEYRAHVAACPSCLAANGGEREIERVMAVAVRARDEERWEPALRAVTLRRLQSAGMLALGRRGRDRRGVCLRDVQSAAASRRLASRRERLRGDRRAYDADRAAPRTAGRVAGFRKRPRLAGRRSSP